LVETNPFLGVRGIRFARRFQDLFDVQLRALLRAAELGDLRIMLPMVATPGDIAWAQAQLARIATELEHAGMPHRADVPLGIMVETPAAVISLDRLARGGAIAFCSIGSNDLAQYTLAADRGDGELARDYAADDPAVFRMIRKAASAAHELGLEISLCGEIGAEPRHAVTLVGLGVDKLSMSASALLDVKAALRATSLDEARRAAARACDAALR